MKHIMVDLETLGKSSDAAIAAIGAVEFDETGTGQYFYTTVNPESCEAVGLKLDASTVMWWMQQSADARAALNNAVTPLGVALAGFTEFVERCQAEQIWGNGATFDNVILASAYAACGLSRPWAFWNDRCYRTLKNLYPQVPFTKPITAHNALDDATAQAKHASQILARLKETALGDTASVR